MGINKFEVQLGLATFLLFLSFVLGAIFTVARGQIDGVTVLFIFLMFIFALWALIVENALRNYEYREHEARLQDIWEDTRG